MFFVRFTTSYKIILCSYLCDSNTRSVVLIHRSIPVCLKFQRCQTSRLATQDYIVPTARERRQGKETKALAEILKQYREQEHSTDVKCMYKESSEEAIDSLGRILSAISTVWSEVWSVKRLGLSNQHIGVSSQF